jgi:hypothetical protein
MLDSKPGVCKKVKGSRMKGNVTTPSTLWAAGIDIIALSCYGQFNGVDPVILD